MSFSSHLWENFKISSPFCMIEPSWKMLLSRRPRWEVVVWICKMQTSSQLILTVFRKELSRTTCLTFVWPSAVEKHLLKCFRCSLWLCLLWIRLNIQICNFYPNKGDVFCISDAVSLWWTIKMWIENFFLHILPLFWRGVALYKKPRILSLANSWSTEGYWRIIT